MFALKYILNIFEIHLACRALLAEELFYPPSSKSQRLIKLAIFISLNFSIKFIKNGLHFGQGKGNFKFQNSLAIRLLYNSLLQ